MEIKYTFHWRTKWDICMLYPSDDLYQMPSAFNDLELYVNIAYNRATHKTGKFYWYLGTDSTRKRRFTDAVNARYALEKYIKHTFKTYLWR